MNSMKYDEVSKEFLQDLYITKNMTSREIAKETGLTKKQVLRLVHKFDIKKKNFFKDRNRYKNILTKEFLYQRYIIDDCSIRELSKETDIGMTTIGKYLLMYGIERKHIGTRKQYENMKKDKRIRNKRPKNTDIKIGHKYGLLTVVGYEGNDLVCKCSCGNKKTLHSSRIRNKQVQSCGCLLYIRGLDNKKCKTYKDIPYAIYKKCIINGKDRNIPFIASIKDLATQYEKQNKKCAISGVDIAFYDQIRDKKRLSSSASLDRIDSSKPYEKDNIQWVHKVVQQMKWTSDQKEFIDWCKIIAQNNS